jgi:hypothetical protein
MTNGMDAVAPWVALGAVALGVAGLVREMSRRRGACDTLRMPLVTDHQDATPPHGDKLLHQIPLSR